MRVRAIWRDEAIRAGAAGFRQFGCDHQIDVAGLRIERHHGLWLAGLQLLAKHLDVVGRCAGALRDAGNRCRLANQILVTRCGQNPVGHDTATLTAKCGNQNGDRMGFGHATNSN